MRYNRFLSYAGASALSLGLLAGLTGCNQPETTADNAPAATVAPASPTVTEIFTNPGIWQGKAVTVSGGVKEVLGPRSFTIGDEGMLVITAQPLAADVKITENAVVQVSGTVRYFEERTLEQELGFDLEDDFSTRFINQLVLVAQSVDVVDQQTTVINKETNVTIVKPEGTGGTREGAKADRKTKDGPSPEGGNRPGGPDPSNTAQGGETAGDQGTATTGANAPAGEAGEKAPPEGNPGG